MYIKWTSNLIVKTYDLKNVHFRQEMVLGGINTL